MMQIWSDVLDQWRLDTSGRVEILSVKIEPIFRPLTVRSACGGHPCNPDRTLRELIPMLEQQRLGELLADGLGS
jgi:hypothetical protein